MKRLKKISGNLEQEIENNSVSENNSAEYEVIKDLLGRIDNSANEIRDAYYVLLDNLNVINKNYIGVYNELKLTVKMPTEKDIQNIVQLQTSINDTVKMLNDDTFLSSILKK